MTRWRNVFIAACLAASLAVPVVAQVKRAGSTVNSPAVAEITLPDGSYITPPVYVQVDSAGRPITPGTLPPASSTPLSGTSTGAGIVGPFYPTPGRTVTIELSASSWPGGNAQVLRSSSFTGPKLPLTPAGVTVGVYSGQGVDHPWTETADGAAIWLSLPGPGIAWRLSN